MNRLAEAHLSETWSNNTLANEKLKALHPMYCMCIDMRLADMNMLREKFAL